MCGAVTQGTVALPGSEATSRMNGSRRNLGDLTPPAVATAIPGHDRKSRRRSCWGRREESDGGVVPMKPRTKPTTNRQRREWREGGRSKERRAATHAPDSEPGRRVTEAASLRVGKAAMRISMATVTVHHFEVWDISRGDWVRQPLKSTAERIM